MSLRRRQRGRCEDGLGYNCDDAADLFEKSAKAYKFGKCYGSCKIHCSIRRH
eukprot:Gb_01828 [translate_table: standard]